MKIDGPIGTTSKNPIFEQKLRNHQLYRCNYFI